MNKFCLVFFLVIWSTVAPATENMIKNGSFEEDVTNWGYEEWKGLPLPGRISEKKPYAGKKCFVLTEPGKMSPRYIRSNSVVVNRNSNYLLRFALATQDIIADSIKVRILQYGVPEGKKTPVVGWLSLERPGVFDLVPDLSGTVDWKVFEVRIPGSAFNAQTNTIALFFTHQNVGLGELKIDAVELIPIK